MSGTGQSITANGIDSFHPDFSPDGQKFAYITQQAGKQEIREKLLAGGEERALNSANG